ncbi:hypothetical protein BDR26DRAFT_859859 [Obelidium mucronatum]|nr:hypothetical protein BDR26DRAFT_859859 [Obelidium mucronatum]
MLESHYNEWTEDTKRGWKKLLNIIVTFMMEDEDGKELMDDHLVDESEGNNLEEVIMHLISKIESNGFGIWATKAKKQTASEDEPTNQEDEKSIESLQIDADDAGREEELSKPDVCIGRALYPFASYFNHSCDPNCEPIQDQIHLTFKTRRRIEAGEELTIAYMDTNVPLASRRSALLQDYFFECCCDRCLLESKAKPNQRAKITFSSSGKGGKQPKDKQPKKKKLVARGNIYESPL